MQRYVFYFIFKKYYIQNLLLINRQYKINAKSVNKEYIFFIFAGKICKYAFMNILITIDTVLPVKLYGGTERVVWYLSKTYHEMGHRVYILAPKGSSSPYATIIERDYTKPISSQIPECIDIVHFNAEVDKNCTKPYVVTIHDNAPHNNPIGNCIYVSSNHAQRNGSSHFVYNGLDWSDYGAVELNNKRDYYHFLAKAAWRVKNVRGAIRIIDKSKDEKLKILGGKRINIKMGFRFTLSPKTKFYGMVGGEEKISLLMGSKGLIFPVLWDEPFGLAITESLYFGAPVFGTQRGSLPELVNSDVGFLSNDENEIISAIKNNNFSRKICHEYARDLFNARVMAENYIKKYEEIINNGALII